MTSAGLPANWRFVTPSPQGNDLIAGWAAAPDDLFVGGHGGLIQHWNGTNWTRMNTPTTKTIYALHGLSSRDVWAVGGDAYTTNQMDHSLILHWDGQKWTEQTPPNYSGWTYALNAVCAVGPKDVWATTDIGTFPVHYDGAKWQFIPIPLSVEGSFKAIARVGGNLFLVGTHGQIVRYHEGNWTLEQKTETGNFSVNILHTIWGTDLENVYVGGSWGQVYRRNADGTWTDLELGTGLFGGLGMVQIWGTSPADVYLQGIQSIRHYNGNVITRTNDYQFGMRRQWLSGAAAGDRIYGLGPGGVVSEFVLDGNGSGVLSPLSAGGEAYLSLSPKGAAVCGANGLLVFGSSVYRGDTSPLVYFDGHNYHDFPSLPPGMAAQSMVNAVWAGSLQDVVIAWDNMLSFGHGVHRWNGSAWEGLGSSWSQPYDAAGLWQSPAGKLYVCSTYRVMRWNGTDDWTQIYAVPEPEMQQTVLNAIWGRSDSEIYVGAKNGKILRFDGATWKTESTPGAGTINGISGNASDIYAVGDNALVWRRAGSAWQRVAGIEQREGDNFTQIVTASDGVYAAQRTPAQYTGGGLGLLWRFNGATATLVLKGLSQPIDVLGFTGGHLYGISAQSFIVTDRPAPAGLAEPRVDLSSTNWMVLGDSGVELRSPAPSAGRPIVAAWRVEEPSSFLSDALPEARGAGQHWFVRADTFTAGSALPPVLARFHYDPARLPAGFTPETARLFRYDGKTWKAVAASVDPVAHTISSEAPAGAGEWTLGTMPPMELPTLAVKSDGGQRLILSWPASAGTAQLESTPSLVAGSWTAVTSQPIVTNGTSQVTIEVSGQTQFYRLRK